MLYGVLQHSGAELSAHQTIEAEYELHGGIDRLAAELETIAADAQRDRFVDLLGRSGLTADQHAAVIESSAFGPLTAALRRAEAYHHDLERLVPRVVGRHGLDDADDIAAVLRYRVDKLAATPPRGCRLRPRLIAGLIPEPLGAMSAEDRQAIDERKELIESRARSLAEDAVVESSRRGLGDSGAPRPHRCDANAGSTQRRRSRRTETATRSPPTCRSVEERRTTLSAQTVSVPSPPCARQVRRTRTERLATSPRMTFEPFRCHRWRGRVVLHRDDQAMSGGHRTGVSRKCPTTWRDPC